jgi:hypothetical protein
MARPSPSPGSTAGQSLVGTLLAIGALLAMVTTGFTLAAATEARFVLTARVAAPELEQRDCPAHVLQETEDPSSRTCHVLTVVNDGDAAGVVRCEITDAPEDSIARFDHNGVSVYSFDIDAHETRTPLIRVDDGGAHAAGLAGTCTLVPIPAA